MVEVGVREDKVDLEMGMVEIEMVVVGVLEEEMGGRWPKWR